MRLGSMAGVNLYFAKSNKLAWPKVSQGVSEPATRRLKMLCGDVFEIV